MKQRPDLKNLINNRTVAVCLQGKSIQELEDRIEEFKDFDICWASLGVFDIIQDNILSKGNKHLEIVFDCATVPHSRIPHYEKHFRVPRLENFFNESEENIWITSYGMVRDSVALHYPHFFLHHENKMLLVDKLFPISKVAEYMNVPNSITLFIGALMAGGARDIIIFGLDGYTGDISKGVDSYYMPEVIAKERMAALGSVQDEGINRDSTTFEDRFSEKCQQYEELFKWKGKIINCSPSSMFKIPTKHTYDKTIGYLNEPTT